MRILIVSTESEQVGGGFVSTEILASALKKMGYDVYIGNFKNFKKMNLDIVLHQNIRYLVQTQRICEKNDIPLIVTVNSFISCCEGTHITNDDKKYGKTCEKCGFIGCISCSIRNKSNKAYNMKSRINQLIAPIFKYIVRNARIKALNKADKVICISPTMKKMLKIAGVNEEKMEIIPQPVDNSFLEDPKIRLFEDERVCLFVGGGWIKGYHLAVEAVSKLNNVKLAFIGPTSKDSRKKMRNFLGDRILFCGVIPHDEIKKYYYSAHVVLFPSIWFEAFGRVWAEACMCGKPVVAFKGRGGASDYLKHEETALLSDYDVDEYAEQIKRLFEDEALYKKISRNAREYAKKNFSADVVAKKYEKVFEEVLNER